MTTVNPTDRDLAHWQIRQAAVLTDPADRIALARRSLRAVQTAPSLSAARNLATLALARMDWMEMEARP